MTERGYTKQKDDYLKRLRRIEGQIRGLQRMVADDEYCIDVLTQVSAATRPCRASPSACSTSTSATASPAPRRPAGDDEAERLIDEATNAIERLVKS